MSRRAQPALEPMLYELARGRWIWWWVDQQGATHTGEEATKAKAEAAIQWSLWFWA